MAFVSLLASKYASYVPALYFKLWQRLWGFQFQFPCPSSHFYFDINFSDRLYSKQKRPGSPLLFYLLWSKWQIGQRKWSLIPICSSLPSLTVCITLGLDWLNSWRCLFQIVSTYSIFTLFFLLGNYHLSLFNPSRSLTLSQWFFAHVFLFSSLASWLNWWLISWQISRQINQRTIFQTDPKPKLNVS